MGIGAKLEIKALVVGALEEEGDCQTRIRGQERVPKGYCELDSPRVRRVEGVARCGDEDAEQEAWQGGVDVEKVLDQEKEVVIALGGGEDEGAKGQ